MIDWLKKRLTPAKQSVDRWTELAEADQTFWETEFVPESQRILNLRSVFTAAADDIVTIMDELGDCFRSDIGTEEDRPIQVLWRRLELQGKESASLIHMALKRKFMGMDAEWTPVYHLKGQDYGTSYEDLDAIERGPNDLSDYFLTSKGKLTISADSLSGFPLSLGEIYSAVDEEMERLLPTHITFMGTKLVSESGVDLKTAIVASIRTHVTVEPYIPQSTIEDTDIYHSRVHVVALRLQVLAADI